MLLNKKSKKMLNKRLMANVLDFYILMFCNILLSIIFIKFNLNGYYYLFFDIVLIIIYFGGIVSLTKGYTLGGFIIGVRIKSLSKRHLTPIFYLKRFFKAIIYYIIVFFSHKILINSLGQFDYDKELNTYIEVNDITLNENKNELQLNYFYDIAFPLLKYLFLGMIIILLIFSLAPNSRVK